MESIITLLIYIHAFFGGVGLISGIISVSVKKGATNHKRAGKIFSYAMLTSSVIALVISNMPQHHNVFLFLIGLFTIYLVLAGNRALTLHHKIKRKADWKDQAISGSMFLISLFMLMLGLLGRQYHFENSILYIFFGGFGVFLTLKDFQTFKRFTKKKNAGLMNHIGRMVRSLNCIHHGVFSCRSSHRHYRGVDNANTYWDSLHYLRKQKIQQTKNTD